VVAATKPADGLRTEVAQIGPREYAVTAWGEGAAEGLGHLEATLRDLVRRSPSALLVDVRALTLLDSATFDTVASTMREVRDAGVFVVLVADWRDLGRAVGVDGLNRFVAIRPTLASAIEAVRGRYA